MKCSETAYIRQT